MGTGRLRARLSRLMFVLLASFHRLQQIDIGVREERVLTFEVNLPTVRYDQKRRASVQELLADRFVRIPGVTFAGGISRLPATGSYHPWNIRIISGPLAGTPIDRSRFAMQQRVVSGNPFAALGIPLVASILVLTVVALFAAWLPARRAARVEPRVAMQQGH
jgi:hypothetical protein